MILGSYYLTNEGSADRSSKLDRGDGKIFCDCGVSHDLAVRDGDDYVDVLCRKCGCSKRYFCESSPGTQELFDADEVHLIKE